VVWRSVNGNNKSKYKENLNEKRYKICCSWLDKYTLLVYITVMYKASMVHNENWHGTLADVNEHERLSNFTLRHKLKWRNSAFIAVLHFIVTIRSSIMNTFIP
jgi:hypothetical protein